MNHIRRQCRVITQPGVVTAVHGTEADIQIVQTSACSSCRIRGVCQPGDAQARTIRVANRGGLTPGARVDLTMPERYGWMGVVFAFVVPLALVVGLLFALATPLGSQELAALVGLGALAPYYGVLYLTRHLFSRIVQFDATPSDAIASVGALNLVDASAFHKEGVQ